MTFNLDDIDFDLDFEPTVLSATASTTATTATVEIPGAHVVEVVPEVVERVRAAPVQGTAYVAKVDESWGWSDLRDYICTEIEARHGAQVRDPKKEASIVKGFMRRWPDGLAVRIARTAFEVHDGMWRGAPISINRFCLASDPWFAQPIAKNF